MKNVTYCCWSYRQIHELMQAMSNPVADRARYDCKFLWWWTNAQTHRAPCYDSQLSLLLLSSNIKHISQMLNAYWAENIPSLVNHAILTFNHTHIQKYQLCKWNNCSQDFPTAFFVNNNKYMQLFIRREQTISVAGMLHCFVWSSLADRRRFSYTSHTRTVVRECCKGDDASQWENGKFDPLPRPNPLTDRHKKLHTWLCRGYLPTCKI